MVTKEELKKKKLYDAEFSEHRAYRVTNEEMAIFDNTDLPEILDEKIDEYFEKHGLRRSSAAVADLCQTNEKTIRNYLAGRVPIPRKFLYKFAVGLDLTLEDANDLFSICGGELNEKCREDYIVIRAIEMGDDIDGFIKNYNENVKIKENRIKPRGE